MSTDYNEVFVDVVSECHRIIRDLELRGVGIDDVRGVEKAIEMAIERRHSAKPKEHLLNDVLRNGRFSTRRSGARERALVQRCGNEQQRMITGKARIPGDFVAPASPHSRLEGRELMAHLCDEAGRCGGHGPRVLEGLLAGEDTAAISAASGVSASTVQRTVRHLRQAPGLSAA